MRWWRKEDLAEHWVAWAEAGRPTTLAVGSALMEEIELREAFVDHFRRLQSGEDSPYPIGGAIIRGLGNSRPGDIRYENEGDSWSSLAELIDDELAEIADLKFDAAYNQGRIEMPPDPDVPEDEGTRERDDRRVEGGAWMSRAD